MMIRLPAVLPAVASPSTKIFAPAEMVSVAPALTVTSPVTCTAPLHVVFAAMAPVATV